MYVHTNTTTVELWVAHKPDCLPTFSKSFVKVRRTRMIIILSLLLIMFFFKKRIVWQSYMIILQQQVRCPRRERPRRDDPRARSKRRHAWVRSTSYHYEHFFFSWVLLYIYPLIDESISCKCIRLHALVRWSSFYNCFSTRLRLVGTGNVYVLHVTPSIVNVAAANTDASTTMTAIQD